MKQLSWLLILTLVVTALGVASFATTDEQVAVKDDVTAATGHLERRGGLGQGARLGERPTERSERDHMPKLMVEDVPDWYYDAISWAKTLIADMVSAETIDQTEADAYITHLDEHTSNFEANGFPVLARGVVRLDRIIAKSGVKITEAPAWFTASIAWQKDQIANFVASEELTEAQATAIVEHLDARLAHVQENGFSFIKAQFDRPFADLETVEVPDWYRQSVNWTKTRIQEELDAGTITADQAAALTERVDEQLADFEADGFPAFGPHGAPGHGRGGRRH